MGSWLFSCAATIVSSVRISARSFEHTSAFSEDVALDKRLVIFVQICWFNSLMVWFRLEVGNGTGMDSVVEAGKQ